ncbi:MAG: hypothetical protein KC493_13870 [Bacteriovoracaceae bacterium]|nr:hypothetical protein [Bacteriovoracaceae bacterium]
MLNRMLLLTVHCFLFSMNSFAEVAPNELYGVIDTLESIPEVGTIQSHCSNTHSFNLSDVHNNQVVGMYFSSGEGLNDPGLQFYRTLKKYPKTKSFLWYSGTALSYESKDAKTKYKCKDFARRSGYFDQKVCGLSGLLESAKQKGVTVQIGYESNKFVNGKVENLDVTQFAAELSDPDSEVRQNVISYAKKLKESGAAVVLRPLSEMNDKGMPWDIMDEQKLNDYAKSWKLMKEIFDNEGANNVKFSFNPIDYGHASGSFHSVKKVIRKIGTENIDIAGINVYPSSYDRTPVPFSKSIKRWKNIYRAEGLGDKPFIIGESNALGYRGYSADVRNRQKGKWMKDALEYFEEVNSNSDSSDDITNFTIFNGFEKGGKYAIPEDSPSDQAIDSHLGT